MTAHAPRDPSAAKSHDTHRRARDPRGPLAALLSPSSVAVIGASRDPAAVGHRVLRNVIEGGFTGRVYGVNRNATEVAGLPAFASVGAIPGPVDLAILAVPADSVLAAAKECARKDVGALVVLSAGFAEVGPEGAARERELVAFVRRQGMRMVGPNCLGILTNEPAVRLNATFVTGPVPPAGNIAMASQSGAVGFAVLDYARERGLGLSAFVSIGNRADVSSNDLLEHWEDDPRTGVVLLYLESLGNPRRFAAIAQRVATRKPILAVSGGRSRAGKRAAASHTASLAADDAALDALLYRAGVQRVATLEEMFEAAALLSSQPLPRGPRVAILANAGGPAILCADACDAAGLELPELPPATAAKLRSFLPPHAAVANPVDLTATAGTEVYQRALTALLEGDAFDAVILIHVEAGAAMVAAVEAAIAAARTATPAAAAKPILGCWLGRAPTSPGATPAYRFPESAARALALAWNRSRWLARPRGSEPELRGFDPGTARVICGRALAERGDGWLLPDEARDVLTAIGIAQVKTVLCRTADEAAEAARKIGFPVAVKLASTEIVHKSEWGGVRLDLAHADAVRGAFATFAERLRAAGREQAFAGVVVQPMQRGGVELMIGATRDPEFVPLVAFGLGGIHVELLRDVVVRVAPLTDVDAREMIEGIRGRRILEGFRGAPPADRGAIQDVLLRIGRLIEVLPVLRELDLNPMFALAAGEGIVVADARIRVAHVEPPSATHPA